METSDKPISRCLRRLFHKIRPDFRQIEALPETGSSALGMSHRSSWFRAVLDKAEQNLMCV